MLRIGIYGGAFAPIHIGHVAAAKAFMRQMWLDGLFVIPTGLSPHKGMDQSASSEDRMNMCRIAFEGVEGVIVSDMEIKRAGKSYSVDTLRSIDVEDSRIFMLCGTDMMLTLDEWNEPDEIFRLCYPVYMRREKDAMLDGMIVNKLAKYYSESGKMFRKLVGEPIELNSTEIREAVKNGQSISNMVPPKVEKYIIENALYK